MADHMPGDPIDLRWDSAPTEWYVRGHVGDEVAIAWATEDLEEGDRRIPSHFVVRHMWGRWSCEANLEEWPQVLRTYWESGPGRFPITTAFNGDDWDHLNASRERRKAENERAAWVAAERWPGAKVCRVIVQTKDRPTLVELQFPWSEHGTVRAELDGDRVLVPRGDLEAWNERAGVPHG